MSPSSKSSTPTGRSKFAGPFLGRRRQAQRQPCRHRGRRQGRRRQCLGRQGPLCQGRACSHRSKSASGTGCSTSHRQLISAVNRRIGAMNYWLFKSEPSSFSWEMLKAKGKAGSGMGRRAQLRGAQQHAGDADRRSRLLLSFQRGARRRRHRRGLRARPTATPPPTTRAGNASTSAPCGTCPSRRRWTRSRPTPKLAEMALVRLGRLSVQPVTPAEWKEVCRMGGLDPAP